MLPLCLVFGWCLGEPVVCRWTAYRQVATVTMVGSQWLMKQFCVFMRVGSQTMHPWRVCCWGVRWATREGGPNAGQERSFCQALGLAVVSSWVCSSFFMNWDIGKPASQLARKPKCQQVVAMPELSASRDTNGRECPMTRVGQSKGQVGGPVS